MSKVPKLRFKEFKNNWQVGALEPHVDVLSGVPLKSGEIREDEKGVPILRGINITEGFIRHSKDIDRYYLGSIQELEKFLIKEGDLVIGMDGSKVGKNVAIISKKDSGSILIQRVARIRNKPTSDIRFIYHHIFSPKFHRYVDEVNTSSGIPHISMRQICEFEIGFPSLPEQQKIASFLSAVDEKIQQLTRKKQLLEQYKKGVMQQLFSGKLRFRDKNGKAFPKWEEKRLGDVGVVIRGASPRPKGDKRYYGGTVPRLMVQDVTRDGKYVTPSTDFLTEEGAKLSRPCKAGTLTIVCSGTVGIPSFLAVDACIHDGFLALIDIAQEYSSDYIYHNLSTLREKLESNATHGGVFTNLTTAALKDFEVVFPCKEEQQKIASFLTALDAKIESVARQITHTQTFKKGLLQQMFV